MYTILVSLLVFPFDFTNVSTHDRVTHTHDVHQRLQKCAYENGNSNVQQSERKLQVTDLLKSAA
jgi:hypothetical protein